MPLATHHVDFVGTIQQSLPVGMFSLIGEDGNHYVVSSAGGGSVCCAEADSVIKAISQTDFRSDAAGLGLTYAASAILNNQCILPLPGTSKFYLIGTVLDANGVGHHANMLVRYNITDTSTVTVDGGFLYVTSTHKYVLRDGYCWGARIIGGQLYAVVDGGTFSPATQSNFVLALPIAGTVNDPTIGSWDTFATDISAQLPWTHLRPPTTNRNYFNRCTIVSDQSFGVGFYYYFGLTEADEIPYSGAPVTATMWYLGVDTTGHTIGTLQDVTASFGIPFSDTHKKFDDTASSDGADDYTSPSIGASTELIMTRTFSDNKQYFRYRRFTRAANGTITVVDNGVAQCSTITISTTAYFVELYREGDDLNSMLRDNRRFIFLGQTLAPPTTSGTYIPKIRHI